MLSSATYPSLQASYTKSNGNNKKSIPSLPDVRNIEKYSFIIHVDSFRDSYRSFANIPETFRDVPETFQEIPETFQDVPESFTDIPVTFQDVPETFQDVPETFRDDNKTFRDDNKNNKFIEEINKFAKIIHDDFQIIVEIVDESYTSKHAVEKMVEVGRKKQFRRDKNNLNKFAASVILSEFLG